LLPYFYIHIEKESIYKQRNDILYQINQLNNKIKQVKNGIYILGESNNIFKAFHDHIIRGPEDLRAFAVNLWLPNSSHTGTQDTVDKGFKNCSMMPAVTYEWLDCNVRMKIPSQLDGYKQLLYHNITVPVLTVGEVLLESKDKLALKEELDNIQQSLVDKLDNQKKEMKIYPQIFTLIMSGNAEVNIIFNEMFLDSWNEYEQIIGNQTNRLKALLSEIQSNLDRRGGDLLSDLEEEKKRLQKTSDELLSQMDQIDNGSKQSVSSFQNILLIEMIPLYPMSLAFGFLVSMSRLRDVYQLRGALYQLYKKRYSESDMLVNERLVVNAPLWIDPLKQTQNHVARFFVLVIPFLFFLITVIMLVYIWFFIHDALNLFSDVTYFSRTIYGMGYMLGIAISTYSFLIIIKEYNLILPLKFKEKQ
jgi:archaellum component FlaC